MKTTNYLWLAGIPMALVAASCSSENEAPASSGEAVTFSSYINQSTKSLEKSSFQIGDELCMNAFMASETTLDKDFEPNFMENETLTKTEMGWTYANSKYWPLNTSDRISFVVSYPNIQPTIESGICNYAFTVNDNPDLQQDFLWSTITDAHRTDRNGSHQNGILETPATKPLADVTLHFRHALSKIVFKAKAATYYNNATITVTDIKVNNLYNEGTYSLSKEYGKGEWTLSGDANHNYIALTGGTTTAINTYLKDFGTSLLMMPQTLSKEASVTIKYTVNYANPSKTTYEERTFPLTTAVILAWEQDKVYSYNFNITLDMITFDAVIDSWGENDFSEITIQ